jgi:tetratricopeptide (TPR) repeat protein
MKPIRTIFATAALLGLAVALVACPREDKGAESGPDRGALTALQEPEHALSEHLMIALGQAKNLHHKADVYVEEGKIAEATQSVRQILDIDFPEDAPEAQDVKLDALARLGKLLVLQGKLDEAWDLLDSAVKSTDRESFFLANVHTVRGEILEARAALLEESDPEGARDLKRQAIVEYDRHIQIGNKLLEEIKQKEAAQ